MKKTIIIYAIATAVLFALFLFVLIAVLTIDVQPTGLENTVIGLATINLAVFNYFNVNMPWYYTTGWLSISAIIVAFSFSIFGLIQLIKRRSLLKVDYQILLLGAIYVLIIGIYVLFEFVVINYRPIIIGDDIAASFPSSSVLMVVSVMGTAIVEINRLFRYKKAVRIALIALAVELVIITVVGRQFSGVHWFTDILAGVLLGTSITLLYKTLVLTVEYAKIKRKAQ
ncbi:MAG: phosphoesterase PA-phosphatase [Candidatus Coproplasma sp.]